MYKDYFKRLFDLFLSIIAIIVLSPILLITSCLIYFKLGSPVIFKQKRPGKNGKIFQIYKFRTMNNNTDNGGELLPSSERLTLFGRKLRASSIDELPELINIIKGDMSIVGPRPLLVKYLPRYNKDQRHRHDVRPGLTGLAQVNGRNAISWEDKFEFDVKYVRDITLWGDCKIILQTATKVIKKKDISPQSRSIMEEFRGTK